VKTASLKDDVTEFLDKKLGWKHGEWTLEMTDTTGTIRCFDRPFKISFGEFEDVYAKGNTIIKACLVQDNYTVSVSMVCRIKVSVPVAVAAKTVQRGEVISPADLVMTEKDITVFRYDPFFTTAEACGMIACRTIPAGAIIHSGMISPLPAVCKGDIISVTASEGVVRVSLKVRARENGLIGDKIYVENTDSHKIFMVKITGPGIAATVSRRSS
jgi:flagella basal body P-ring formation protein FlgA